MIAKHVTKQQFVSIIWGYHSQLFSLSAVENYHLHALASATALGYKTSVFLIQPRADIMKDPHFDTTTPIEVYRGPIQFLSFLWKNRSSIFYVNSFVWQSCVVPFLCRKTIFMGHDSVQRKSTLKQRIQNIVFSFFTRIRVISTEEKLFLMSQGVEESKIFIAPLAIDSKLFVDQPNVHRKDLVFLGNVTPDKNIQTILRALQRVKNDHSTIVLHILGEVREKGFDEMVRALDLTNNIVVEGFVPHAQLNIKLNQYVISVNSSISEGQCLAVYESGLAGLALCLPQTMSFSGIFKDKALFHKPFDADILANNILTYLADEQIRNIHVASLKKMIISEYAPSRIADKEMKLFSLTI